MRVVSRAVAPRRPPSPRRLRRQRSRWPLLIPLVALAAWGGYRFLDDPGTTAAVPPKSAGSTVPAPTSTIVAFGSPTGERSTGARCWMVVIDESASMATADRDGTRADAVRATTEFLAAYGLTDDRIGVTWFADFADAETPHAPTAAAAARAPVPPTDLGGGTLISGGLGAALDAMDEGCGATQRVVVLVSDGQANDQAEFDATSALIRPGGDRLGVHLIAMNGARAYESARQFWEDPALGLASIHTISTFGRDEVGNAVAEILTIETGQQVTPR